MGEETKRPTIHVTNASSRALHHGAVYNIMARPRVFERHSGNVAALTPSRDDLSMAKAGRISLAAYRERCVERFSGGALAPGDLKSGETVVESGDTLVCACSRAAASRGECHRVWAAEHLRAAGWDVVLDGVASQSAGLG